MEARNYSTLFRRASARTRRYAATRGRLLPCLFALLLSPGVEAALPQSIDRVLDKYGIAQDSVSAVVTALDSAEVLLEHRAEQPRNPASVMKLLTTFAALDILGPAHTWETHYYINGKLENGVLEGDLVIKGLGDPYLVQERFWLQLAALRELGLETITGRLLIDNSAFSLPQFDRAEFDQQPTRLYNVGPSATVLNFNASRFRLHPVDGRVEVLLDPPVHNIVINNQLEPAAGNCHSPQGGWSVDVANRDEKAYVVFRGSYRTDCGNYDLRRTVLDSDAYLYGMFVHLWNNLGGKFSGGYAFAEVKEDAVPFYTGVSKPLSEVITGANKFSNNLLARQLLLTIGYHYFGSGTSVEDGIHSIESWLKDKGLEMPELVIENGAGLSRSIQLSAGSLDRLLRYAADSPYQPEFLASFALGGLDGTMKKRLQSLELGGRARLKTGYVNGVRTLAGYIRADSGRDYAVVLFINDPRVNFSNGNVIQDEFIKWVLAEG